METRLGDEMKTALAEPKHCGNCQYCHVHVLDPTFCEIHPEYGEICERDTCGDWSENEEL